MITIEQYVYEWLSEHNDPEAAAAAEDARIAEAKLYWRGRIDAHRADDEEYVGEAADRGHR